jgi:uncharacterized protein (DUF302 family)
MTDTAGALAPASYGLRRLLDCSFAEALARVGEALGSEGFGVLTEIDVRETLKKKLDIDFRRYKILGTCNPSLAHRALQADSRLASCFPAT